MNIAIVDDISMEIDRLTTVIEKYMEDNHLPVNISSFNSAEEFLADYRPLKYTLIFMDIYMDQMSGIEASKKIREMDSDTLIVFLTTSLDHTFDAFGVHAFQYLIKSPDDETLKFSVCKVLDEVISLRSAEGKKISIVVDGENIDIAFSDIVYAQSQKNYIQLTDRLQNGYRTRMTFSDICELLKADSRFLQINRGIMINMDHITNWGKTTCELKGGHMLPVNVREQKTLNQIRQNYVFAKLHSKRTMGGAK